MSARQSGVRVGRGHGPIDAGHLRIHRTLFLNGPMTTSELLARLDADGHRVDWTTRTQFRQLRTMGIIGATGTRSCPATGRRVSEWDVIAALPRREPERAACPHCRRPWSP